MTVIVTSHKELARIEVLRDLEVGRISADDAARLVAVSRRQAFRLLAAFRRRGPEALVSARRGRPSDRRLPDELRRLAVAIVRERYADFGPTLAAEKLAERHGLSISRETPRQWMIAAGLWLDRRRRLPPVHRPRPRRECPGELVRIDGCEHRWFEGRGPGCSRGGGSPSRRLRRG